MATAAATTAAINTFMRIYSNPEGEVTRKQFYAQAAAYRYRWAYYNNSAFDDLAMWSTYKSTNRLYRFTRSIYNPAARLVDFYCGAIYPGRLTVEKGKKSAVPLSENTPDPLRAAIGQIFQWSNWQENKSVMTRYGAALGDVFLDIVDDAESGTVTLQNVWPGFVTCLELDPTGNVKEYKIEYDTLDDEGDAYHYCKHVDGKHFAIYRDDEIVAEYANPYGFVAAAWIRHRNEGIDHGAPAMRNVSKWDELNSLASHIHDQLHKLLAAPVIIGGSGQMSALDADNTPKAGNSYNNQSRQESLGVLKGPPDVSVHAVSLPDAAGVTPHIERLLAEIEHDHPELTFYTELRGMQNVTGPAALALMGDVWGLLSDAQAVYDQQLTKALQMAVAIGGWRLSQRHWRNPTRQQQAFAGFDLESYARGDLDFTIDERPLIPANEADQINLDRQRLALKQDQQNANPQNQPAAIAQRLAARGAQAA